MQNMKKPKNYYTDSCYYKINFYITELCFGRALEKLSSLRVLITYRIVYYDLHIPSYCTLGKAIELGRNIIITH